MEFQRVSITPEGSSKFDVLFNPTQYGLDKANQISEIAIPGLEAPILQYVHGNTRTLSMELFVDTYEERTDVSAHTNKIYDLLKIVPSTHAPPICQITWGNFHFRGVVDHVSGRFTLFLSDGTPVRATLNVTFKEYIDVDQLVKVQPTESSDHQKTRVVKRGDRIDHIAAEEYGDPAKWRPIAEANNLDDPSHLVAGAVLSIPPLDF
jgi:Contractile injection system tube protein